MIRRLLTSLLLLPFLATAAAAQQAPAKSPAPAPAASTEGKRPWIVQRSDGQGGEDAQHDETACEITSLDAHRESGQS